MPKSRLVSSLAAVVLAGIAQSQVATFNQSVSPAGGDPASRFGAALGISGGTLVVGAPDDTASNIGRVYLYSLSSGSELASFRTPGWSAAVHVGEAISVDANRLVVGTPGYGCSGCDGVAHVYQIAPLQHLYSINSPEGTSAFNFGFDAAIDCGRVAVSTGGSRQTHLFDATTGDLVAQLQPTSPNSGDSEPRDMVAIGDGLAIVNVNRTGRVFDADTGAFLGELSVDELPGNNWLYPDGATIGEGYIAIPGFRSEPGVHEPPAQLNGVYVFDSSTLGLIGHIDLDSSVAIYPLPNNTQVSYHGALAIRNGRLYAGLRWQVAIYDLASFELLQHIPSPDLGVASVTNSSEFGQALAVSDRHLAIGQPTDGSGVSKVFIYDLVQDTCPADTNGDGELTPADFNAWIIAFNNQQPACDRNGNGLCTPADFNAWIINFNAGCP